MLTEEKLGEISTKLNIPLENPLHIPHRDWGLVSGFLHFQTGTSMCECECFMMLQGTHNDRDYSQDLLGLVTNVDLKTWEKC
ncbi:hypothetical protein B7P43_G09543 [Cryptotermes secundus]|uniref:Uncharacterized protein n=1 Tax=Cryptotermes secundus TaxID=105785 RepID=A0A2J7QMV2_9NEOP|nr:hypothetical protein B7P43_G09543 [Cryptotermes secundus]